MKGQLDLETYIAELKSREERDKALKQVSENSEEWFPKAVAALPTIVGMMPPEFSPEELRTAMSGVIGNPHHHNAWGALTNTAVRRKLIVPTGNWGQNRKKESHARVTRLYRARSGDDD